MPSWGGTWCAFWENPCQSSEGNAGVEEGENLTFLARAELIPKRVQGEHNRIDYPPRDIIDQHTGARNKKNKSTTWQANMRKKYAVASRRIAFKRFGIPGYSLDPLAAMKIMKNAKRSVRECHDYLQPFSAVGGMRAYQKKRRLR